MKLRYTYRLRPGVRAVRALRREEGRNRWVWNRAVAARKNAQPKFDDKALTAMHREHEWLREGSVVAQQQTLRDFYQKTATGKRRFRSKKTAHATLNYTLRGFSLRTMGNTARLVVAGGIVLPVVWSRDLPSEPSSVRVYQDAVGHWWASFVVEVERDQLDQPDKALGIDWGVSQIELVNSFV